MSLFIALMIEVIILVPSLLYAFHDGHVGFHLIITLHLPASVLGVTAGEFLQRSTENGPLSVTVSIGISFLGQLFIWSLVVHFIRRFIQKVKHASPGHRIGEA